MIEHRRRRPRRRLCTVGGSFCYTLIDLTTFLSPSLSSSYSRCISAFNLKLHCSLSIKSVSAAPMSLNNFKLNISAAKYAMIAAAPHSLRAAALSVNAINIGKATGEQHPSPLSLQHALCWRQ